MEMGCSSEEAAAAARRGEEHDASDVERGDLFVTPLLCQACRLPHRARCLRSQRLLHHRAPAAPHIHALLEGNELPPSSRASWAGSSSSADERSFSFKTTIPVARSRSPLSSTVAAAQIGRSVASLVDDGYSHATCSLPPPFLLRYPSRLDPSLGQPNIALRIVVRDLVTAAMASSSLVAAGALDGQLTFLYL
ncbi:hypothetical protein TRIUR3_29058 [Triticum urartu]|uniref:Uncharacterized protein n=1 Tax=Triticum urartu TaxID=4572 RepID=M7ZS18_TRIUA|nr:hypothetical protein TRIUR3_29058 [Triticum urartu]